MRESIVEGTRGQRITRGKLSIEELATKVNILLIGLDLLFWSLMKEALRMLEHNKIRII